MKNRKTGHLNEDKMAYGYVKHNAANAHTAHISMTLLRNVFVDRVISKHVHLILNPLIIRDGGEQ
jgi:hypothetical protein